VSQRKPNVVLIVLDAVRADHMSCYGHDRRTTPCIDRIANEGVRYDRAYAASCWTLPSHASLFTGLYPSRHRTDFDTQTLTEGIETMASFLSNRGYETASFSCNGFVAEHTDLTRGFDTAVDVEGGLKGNRDSFGGKIVRAIHGKLRRALSPDRGTDRAWNMTKSWMSEKKDKPFFVFMNFMDCHLPYRLKKADLLKFVDPSRHERALNLPLDPFGAMAGQITYTPEDIEDLKAMYDGALYYLDQYIGRLDEHLRDLGLADDTLILITSDHGESFGEHGLFDHQYGLYENLIQVPLVVRGPGVYEPGRAENGLAQLVDIFPSVAALVGHEGPIGDPSTSATMFNNPDRSFAAAEYLVPNLRLFQRRFPDVDTSHFDSGIRSIRDETYKCLVRQDGRTELYNLIEDPGETLNIYESDVERGREMAALLEERLGPWPDDIGCTSEAALDPLRERLEQLGYL